MGAEQSAHYQDLGYFHDEEAAEAAGLDSELLSGSGSQSFIEHKYAEGPEYLVISPPFLTPTNSPRTLDIGSNFRIEEILGEIQVTPLETMLKCKTIQC